MLKILIALVVVCMIAGCVTHPNKENPPNVLTGDLISSSYQVTDCLLAGLKQPVNPTGPILVATFVNINNLGYSSTFGRMIAEHIASRLSQRGFTVPELRLRTNSIFMEEGRGEFLLSRDLKTVSQNHNASAVVVGTYGRAHNGLYVSARIVNPADSFIMSSCDFFVRFTDNEKAVMMKND
jgi:TolB-like protein